MVFGELTVPFTGFEIPLAVVLLGAMAGTAFALFGIGISLTYQSSRVLNFAQGSMGALPATIVATLVVDRGWGYWPALVLALLVGATSGALLERFVVRRLAKAPRLVVLVATIGAAQLLAAPAALLANPGRTAITRSPFPTPFTASFELGGLRFGSGYMLILIVSPLIVLALTIFLRRTTVGLASRAAAENTEAAALSGIPVNRVSMIVWTISGALAATAAVLAAPTQSTSSLVNGSAGGDLLLFGLGAAMIGGLQSLPQIFLGGVALGTLRAVVGWNTDGGVNLLVTMGLIVAALMFRTDLRQLVRSGEESNWSLADAVRPISARVRGVAAVRRAHVLLAVAITAAAAVLPMPASPSQRVLYSAILVYALVGISLVMLIGWSGQVSLGHFTFVAVGAFVGGRMHQMGYEPTAVVAVVLGAGIVASLVIGVPALRMRGLFLAVTTLAFAVVANAWLFRQDWLFHNTAERNSGVLPRGSWGPFDFQNELTYYYLLLVVLVVCTVGVYHLRQTGVYRSIVAVRDNEAMAATLTLSPQRTKLLAFVLSGTLATFAGYLYGMLLVNFGQLDIGSLQNSQLMVTMVIVGGTTTITGAVAGAVYVRGIPYLFHSTALTLFSGGIGVLVVVLFLRGGLAGPLFRLRDRVVARLAGDAGATSGHGGAPPLEARPRAEDTVGLPPAIEATHITKRYGGLVAVNDASLEVRQGEIVGLLGPNGAGKSTLFDIVSGLVKPDAGSVFLRGQDITGLSTDQRAWLGLGRSFQQCRLFDGLTIFETFQVALERAERTEVVPSLLALPPSRAAEREKRLLAGDLVELLGLGPYAEKTATELSTGTRRIAELGCSVASGADIILLDEPTGGIAQREVEAFAAFLRQLRDHLDATMLIVAHDIPMMVSLVDRLYVMASGEVIAEGPPSLLRSDQRVMAAYLGSDDGTGRPVAEVAG